MHEFPAEPASYQRADSDRQKSESHICALLSRGSKTGNIFVVARLLRDFAHRDYNQRKIRHRHRRMQSESAMLSPRSEFPGRQPAVQRIRLDKKTDLIVEGNHSNESVISNSSVSVLGLM